MGRPEDSTALALPALSSDRSGVRSAVSVDGQNAILLENELRQKFKIRDDFQVYFLRQLAGEIIDLLKKNGSNGDQQSRKNLIDKIVMFLFSEFKIDELFDAWYKSITSSFSTAQQIDSAVGQLRNSLDPKQLLSRFIEFCKQCSQNKEAELALDLYLSNLAEKFAARQKAISDRLSYVNSAAMGALGSKGVAPEVY